MPWGENRAEPRHDDEREWRCWRTGHGEQASRAPGAAARAEIVAGRKPFEFGPLVARD